MNKVYIVGAGPGAPDLITVRGMDLLRKADVLIYAGSLVNPALVEESGAALKLDSQNMKLDEIVGAIEEHVRAGGLVVRLHSGDPSLYGAIVEQMAELERRGIEAEIVPGVSSLFAASAALRTQFTLRDVSESLVITRPAGATLERDLIPEFSRLGQTMWSFSGRNGWRRSSPGSSARPRPPRRSSTTHHGLTRRLSGGRWPISPGRPALPGSSGRR